MELEGRSYTYDPEERKLTCQKQDSDKAIEYEHTISEEIGDVVSFIEYSDILFICSDKGVFKWIEEAKEWRQTSTYKFKDLQDDRDCLLATNQEDGSLYSSKDLGENWYRVC